ncbi:hypothetical protein [Faecalibacter bovis]|uniref:Uncharacterized protein n=1 Tax=Faecalibacter bovis TaxID=2898187 RepID=A0ABX7XDY6_9FLAO|nr:hypothetical protein [Faecalibacter bovis]QTV06054.1 hypothetical protein J9309_01515 [Faecalibacter bovis]
MADIVRNGKAYDSADVKVYINGINIPVVKVTYGNEQEHQLNYTLGENPTSWSKGKKTPSCTIDLMMADVVPLEKAAGGDLLKVKPFNVTVEFVNEDNEIVVDSIYAKFKSQGRDVTGEMGLQMSYELFALKVDFNVV